MFKVSKSVTTNKLLVESECLEHSSCRRTSVRRSRENLKQALPQLSAKQERVNLMVAAPLTGFP